MDLVGRLIGRDYRLERELARGGMGGVWLAEQLSTGQKRALKVMHPTLVAEPRMRERFEQEARVGGRVPSEHVVEVIAAGVDAELGIPWLAMELLQGEDLGQLASRMGQVPIFDLVPIFRQLCHALGAAHSVGIVHRDVKPENVFLAEVQSSDVSRQVKVLDFGIAKLVADAKESGTGQVGTPLWMAPEQSDSRAQITPRVDVWPLGLMAFRLLTGRHYWRTANDVGAGLSALLREALVEPIVPASDRARELGVEAYLPPGFDEFFQHTVARDPEARYPDARTAFQAFEALARGASTLGAVPYPSGIPLTAPSLGTNPSGHLAHAASAPAVSGRAHSASVGDGALSANVSAVKSRSSSTGLLLALGVGVLFLGGALVVAAGAGAWFLGGDRTSPAARVSAASSGSEPGPAAPATGAGEPGAEASAKAPTTRTTRPGSGTAPTTSALGAKLPEPLATASATATPTSASSSASELKPIDVAAVQKRVNQAAAGAAVQCAQLKAPGAASEAYSGSLGFRPDGSKTRFFQGLGGARDCVSQKLDAVDVGKYAHPQVWHVESFPFTVTVK